MLKRTEEYQCNWDQCKNCPSRQQCQEMKSEALKEDLGEYFRESERQYYFKINGIEDWGEGF